MNITRMVKTAAPSASELSSASPIHAVPGIGPTRAKYFRDLGVQTLADLLEYFPRTYQYESAERTIADLVADQIQMTRGEVIAVDYIASRPRPRFEATLDDGTDRLALVFFHGSYLRGRIRPGMTLRVQGMVKLFRNLAQMSNPKWWPIEP